MRTLQGTITSNRMQKTVVVRVDRLRKHAKYKKYHRTSETFKAHVDDAGAYRIGDVVEIEETRPLSRDKRWRVRRVVRGNAAPAADTETDDPSPTIL
ncbi:MAG: 30S ribosomal protein S17 [bacterium]|nr:30S ribosomal protein S17 [bacterium]